MPAPQPFGPELGSGAPQGRAASSVSAPHRPLRRLVGLEVPGAVLFALVFFALSLTELDRIATAAPDLLALLAPAIAAYLLARLGVIAWHLLQLDREGKATHAEALALRDAILAEEAARPPHGRR